MFQPTRILLAALVLATVATAAEARAPATMPATMPAALSAPMPAPAMLPGFRRVTRLGTTKPAGAALDARGGTRPSLDAESRRLDHLVRTAICTGC